MRGQRAGPGLPDTKSVSPAESPSDDVVPDSSVAIQDDIDIVHHLGKLNNRPRPVIICFVKRSTRDLVSGKTLRVPQEPQAEIPRRFDSGRQDAEDEAARKEGKRAFFVGGRAFVDGKAVHPPL
ncbi:nucleoside diphosphate-linked moiety X motif 22 [Labeo rohita]|uniref:Nucleoside diphosphate-linked moiety X motif 22 n=1 Tax=Labeo rohita TaxID=84645 RepID=A0A498L5D8_LABRO|nr:nucleoside diphosphate-linked moiety X motif 22 [Labeo rohita]RXN19196.1 nucleoside diphosphate-linked moiety X motif 22 [Labeo rohita]